MTLNKELLIRVDLYLRKGLSEGETAEFEQQINGDSELAEFVRKYEIMMEGLRKKWDEDFRKKFKNHSQKLEFGRRFEFTKEVIIGMGIIMGIAVTVLLAMLLPNWLGW